MSHPKPTHRFGALALAGSLSLTAVHARPTADEPKAAPADAPKVELASKPTLFVVGYAHLDTQWRWTYVDTIRDFLPSTLNDNFALFAKYPHYVFNFSGSRRYRMMEEYYPGQFKTLREHVAAGRWFPCGSSVDENDANVPSAESLVRHVLYGNKYFRDRFGRASEEFMLPDCFGFPAALPSVLAHCGIKGFSTQKLTWGAVVPIPFKVGRWVGPDGRGVVAALDPGEYVGQVKENLATSESWLRRIQASGKASGVFADYHYFGTGDQGGAPRASSVEMVEKSAVTDGPIKVLPGPADLLFRSLTPAMVQGLPEYQGELMLTEHSAGSISSQAYMKRWNRKNELLADAAERASVLAWWFGARPYPSSRLEDAWYLLLGSQMHDILPGTSLPKAYEYSWNDEVLAAIQFGGVLADAAGAVIAAMDTTARGDAVVVYNPLSCDRQDLVEARVPTVAGASSVRVLGPDGSPVPAQIVAQQEGTTTVAFVASAPSVALVTYDVQLTPDPVAAPSELRVSEHELENAHLKVRIDENGDVASVFEKAAGRETLSAPATLSLHYENPANWPAWNQDWADRQLPPRAVVGGPAEIKVVERGPARVAVEVTRRAEGSIFVQRISLAAGEAGRRVEFDTRVDWRSKERSLRASFPLTASNPRATYDIQTGTVQRGNSHAKQYEYSFHQWYDVTDTGGAHGASVLCDSKYASDKPDDHAVRLTLLYTPGTRGGYPDQGTQDIGRHRVLYALYPHSGDWRDARSHVQAARLNQPMITLRATPHAGPMGHSVSLASTSNPAVSITAIKKGEYTDEVIVRLREHAGRPTSGVRVKLAGEVLSAREVDGQERELGPASIKNGELVADMGANELRAYAVKLGPAPAAPAPVSSKPVTLAFDTDVVSTNSARADGAMNAALGAYPAEQFPSGLASGGVAFTLGPTTDGASNALTCRGQTLDLPPGDHNRVCLLAAAEGDVLSTIEVGGVKSPWNVPEWTGYIGQWDNRLWPGNTSDPAYRWTDAPIGLTPGFIKTADVAWYASHRHAAGGDVYYQYTYVFRFDFDLPAGSRRVILPNDPRIKVFALSVANVGPARAAPAMPLFDTLADHTQDAPVVIGAGRADDTTQISIEAGLYGRLGSIRYTTDNSEPTASSPVVDGPITISQPTVVTAAVFDPAGVRGPVARAAIDVQDRTPPRLVGVDGVFESAEIRVEFSEPVGASSHDGPSWSVTPDIAVTKFEWLPGGRRAVLTLAKPPTPGVKHTLRVHGLSDCSPAGNAMGEASADFVVQGPVFTLRDITPADRGRVIQDTPDLPVRATDSWTINLFVKAESQPPNRTVLAGFGRCEDTNDGAARYLCKFAGGIHFWSRLRDVPTGSQLRLGRWQMVTATYDGRVLRVYHDAKLVGQRAITLADDQNVITILPKDPWEHVRQFEGEICGLTIWRGALSAEALGSLAQAGPAR